MDILYSLKVLPTVTKTINKFVRQMGAVTNQSRLSAYLESENHLKEIVEFIPEKYINVKRTSKLDTMYLIDKYIAKDICKYILPSIQEGHQVVAETSAGLGLVASELLDNNVKKVRLYEGCSEFRALLRDFNTSYPGRVELFKRNFFHLGRISTQDKYERSNRVAHMLKDVPKKAWHEGPVMTIFGCMPDRRFIAYLLKMMAMQAEIVTLGRVQLFAIMKPADYVILSAGPQQNKHTYQSMSVLFDMFFKHELVKKYPRKAFLPWETKRKQTHRTHYAKTIDVDDVYLVLIRFKRKLPVPAEQCLALYFFVKQLFGYGSNPIIPTAEKWIPGCGLQLILPSQHYSHYFKDINIYTKFSELTAPEILSVFKELVLHEGYESSSFSALIQSELIKYETRESDATLLLEDSFDELEEKIEQEIVNVD